MICIGERGHSSVVWRVSVVEKRKALYHKTKSGREVRNQRTRGATIQTAAEEWTDETWRHEWQPPLQPV